MMSKFYGKLYQNFRHNYVKNYLKVLGKIMSKLSQNPRENYVKNLFKIVAKFHAFFGKKEWLVFLLLDVSIYMRLSHHFEYLNYGKVEKETLVFPLMVLQYREKYLKVLQLGNLFLSLKQNHVLLAEDRENLLPFEHQKV